MNCDKINTRVNNPAGYVCPVNRNKASLGLKITSNRYIIFSRGHANNWPNAGLMLCLRLRRWHNIKPALVHRLLGTSL